MEPWMWVLAICFGFGLSTQLSAILRSLQSTEAMIRRFLAHEGIEWGVAVEPSEKVRALAADPRSRLLAIQAYRAQSGLPVKDAKAVVDELATAARESAAAS